MKALLASLVHNVVANVAQNVADRLQGVPRNLDLTYINDRIMAMSQCAMAPSPSYQDDGRKELILQQAQHTNNPVRTKAVKNKGNSPADLSTFLQNQHDRHALIVSLSDTKPDDRYLLLVRRQFLQWNWESPGKTKSETPSLPQLLDLCYTLHAYLNLDPANVVVVSCSNGKTRSAIVVACYLKFAKLVDTSMQGFSAFLSRRCPQLDATQAALHIPPSLAQFFANFDQLMDLGHFSNPKPLLLRAVALQGVPVDDKPCLDIWDSKQNHVYSSILTEESQWADEEGFYRVNQVLEGDFCLLCRFGGMYANDDTNDPSKVLFRYANSAGFLSSGTYELPKKKVDMMRRYEMSFEEDDFLLTLILESYWDSPNPVPGLDQDSKQLPPILQGYAALERGWHLLTEHHAGKPLEEDCHSLRSIFPELQECPNHICKVVLQLTNLDLRQARNMLMDGPMKEWWADDSEGENDDDMQLDENDDYPATLDAHPIRPVTPELTCRDVLNILDDAETDTVDHDRPQSPQHENLQQDAVEDSIRYESILFPNRGDIVDAFGDYSKDLHKAVERFPPVEPLRPRMPLLYKRKRSRTSIPLRKKRRGDEENTQEEREAALKLLEQINHTGMTLDDLLQLQRVARHLMAGEDKEESFLSMLEETPGKLQPAELVSRKSKLVKFEEEDEEEDEDVEGFEVADEDEAHGENDRLLGFVTKKKIDGENTGDAPPLKNDPLYSKYFKMLKMGMPIDVVKHALTRDGKDPNVMDLDHNKSVKSQLEAPKSGDEKSPKSQQGEGDGDDAPPLRDDPDYSKYFKMLKMGLPIGAVKNAVQRDGKDPAVLDLDGDKSLKSQMKSDSADGPPLKEDPDYSKYFKMLKMGLPLGAVKNAVQRDGKDASVMDLDPNKSIKSQMGDDGDKDDGPPLKEDPEYEKVSCDVFVKFTGCVSLT